MSKHIVLASLLVGTLAAGCTGTMNASVTPGTPGASMSPGATASTAPTVSASAGVTVGASTAPVAGNVDATMAAIYKLGRKWAYLTTVTSNPGGKIETPFTQEVTKIEGAVATLKTVTTVNGKDSESTSTVDLSKPADPGAWVNKTTSADGTTSEYTWTQKSVGAEAVTVKAGTYANAQKYVGTLTSKATATGGAAAGTQDATFYTDNAVGLLKSTTKGEQTTTAAGMSFTVKFESVTELQSVTN